jgi:hypothetical protein
VSAARPERTATYGTVPRWGVASSVTAPLALCVGWTVAGSLQTRRYDAIRQTVSVLAAHGATDRWIMTLAFVLVGGCDVVTGLALRPAATPGRLIIVVGGFGGMLVGLSPETIGAGGSARHAFFAAVGFVALTIWPVAASRAAVPGQECVPLALRRAPAVAAAALIAALFGWFFVELIAGGGQLGLAERSLGEAQALWPLAVVASCLATDRARRRDLGANQLPARGTSGERHPERDPTGSDRGRRPAAPRPSPSRSPRETDTGSP